MTKVRTVHVRSPKQRRELFIPRRSLAFALFLVISVAALLVSYAVLDNTRVQLDRKAVSVPTLPAHLEDFSLLVVSDLHGKIFGENQATVLGALASSRVDAVVFLGDMTTPDGDPEAFYTLVEALQTLEAPLYFVPGDSDPPMYDLAEGECRVSAFHQGLLDRNVKYVDRPHALEKSTEGSLWLWPTERLWVDAAAALDTAHANIERLTPLDDDASRAERAYNQVLADSYEATIAAREQVLPGDTHLGAAHYPITPARLELTRTAELAFPALSDASLLLSGHYLAGQFRLPLLGTLHVDAPELPRGGWFPTQEEIAGLTRIGGQFQYISRGLGARGFAPLRWRFFNTPEVALLRLTSRVEVE